MKRGCFLVAVAAVVFVSAEVRAQPGKIDSGDFGAGKETVTFDGLPAASVTFVNGATMTAVTPVHAPGAVDVVVDNVNGTDTLVGGFTYDQAPAVISLSPANGTPFGGDTITITGTDFTADATATFGSRRHPPGREGSFHRIRSTAAEALRPGNGHVRRA